jgi:GYF domain 2
MAAQWFYESNGAAEGPVTLEALRQLLRQRTVSPDILVWNETFGQSWRPIQDTEIMGGMKEPFRSPPPRISEHTQQLGRATCNLQPSNRRAVTTIPAFVWRLLPLAALPALALLIKPADGLPHPPQKDQLQRIHANEDQASTQAAAKASQLQFCSIFADATTNYKFLSSQASAAQQNGNIPVRDQLNAQIKTVMDRTGNNVFNLLKRSNFTFTDWFLTMKKGFASGDAMYLHFTTCDELKTKIILELNGKMRKQDAPAGLLANLKQGNQYVVNGAFTSLSDVPPASADEIAIYTMVSPIYWVRIASVK